MKVYQVVPEDGINYILESMGVKIHFEAPEFLLIEFPSGSEVTETGVIFPNGDSLEWELVSDDKWLIYAIWV